MAYENMPLTMPSSFLKTPPIPNDPNLPLTEPSTLNFMKLEGGGHQEVMTLRNFDCTLKNKSLADIKKI